jgi:hypothetical protein
MHNIKTNFDKIMEVAKKFLQPYVDERGNFPKVGAHPKFSDLSVIVLALTSEAMGIDSENFLFQKLNTTYRDSFPDLIDRSQYNVRKRKLKSQIDKFQKKIAKELDEFEDVFTIDSMPVEVCKIARSSRCKLGKNDFEKAPDKGYCASQQMYYYGYKIHCVCSYKGIIHSYDLTKASVHDIAYLSEVKEQFSDCLILGDKGYLSAEVKLDLFSSANIKLETPMRMNQQNYRPQPYIFRKARKRIETVYSQLCDQFMIRRNYAKSVEGLFSRIVSKIAALSVLQYLNAHSDRPFGHIKNALA